MDWTANFWNHRRQFLVSSRTSAASQPCVSRTHNANLYVGCVCSRAHVFVSVNAWYRCRHGARDAAGNLTRGQQVKLQALVAAFVPTVVQKALQVCFLI